MSTSRREQLAVADSLVASSSSLFISSDYDGADGSPSHTSFPSLSHAPFLSDASAAGAAVVTSSTTVATIAAAAATSAPAARSAAAVTWFSWSPYRSVYSYYRVFYECMIIVPPPLRGVVSDDDDDDTPSPHHQRTTTAPLPLLAHRVFLRPLAASAAANAAALLRAAERAHTREQLHLFGFCEPYGTFDRDEDTDTHNSTSTSTVTSVDDQQQNNLFTTSTTTTTTTATPKSSSNSSGRTATATTTTGATTTANNNTTTTSSRHRAAKMKSSFGTYETLLIGHVSYMVRPNELRWVLKRLTGVSAMKIEHLRNQHTRGRTGMFSVGVRTEDVDAVLAADRRALCCPDFLWVPHCDAMRISIICTRLKDLGIAKNGLLSIQRLQPRPSLFLPSILDTEQPSAQTPTTTTTTTTPAAATRADEEHALSSATPNSNASNTSPRSLSPLLSSSLSLPPSTLLRPPRVTVQVIDAELRQRQQQAPHLILPSWPQSATKVLSVASLTS
ncbi:Hypothetical protein, putative [Bodo saltans]|uniref:Uncharacterized protein n=1 Tax=Bodo saltans TaxID=75058 RepID=A0A0S4J4W0_BODSA|nr:Hypothetical protein, putative [Bodo saltans]|eukprot:CUG86449.1 Hypothetical protein, putative [Bodo saltans]